MDDEEYNALQTKLRKQGSLAVKHESASCKILPDGQKAVGSFSWGSRACVCVCARAHACMRVDGAPTLGPTRCTED